MSQGNFSRNVIVSGGARGIGRAIARVFLEEGHRVYIFDIQEDELEYTVKHHLKKYYEEGKVGSSVCNLRDIKEIRSKVKEAAKFFDNRIDVLVNNASIASPYFKDGKTMEDQSTFEEFQAYIETNLTSAFSTSMLSHRALFICIWLTSYPEFRSGLHSVHED